jgi:excinuclease ABC subunit A
MQHIQVINANEHNLNHIDITLPREKLIVFTGVSGSGKSSLAFDTIFKEAQRRYMDSMGSYARQFMGQIEKPDVERIDGLSPAISIDQKSTSRNPRSTVGTVTEILDYLRLLYAKVGTPHCTECGEKIQPQSLNRIVELVMAYPEQTRVQILAPVVRGRKGDYNALLQQLLKEGYARVQIDGEQHLLEDLPEDYRLARQKRHDISVVIDRVVVSAEDTTLMARLTESIRKALKKAEGFVEIEQLKQESVKTLYSQHYACPVCDISFEELSPRLFSFNSPYGACEACDGLGSRYEIDRDALIPDSELSIAEGALAPLYVVLKRHYKLYVQGLSKTFGINIKTPFKKLSPEIQRWLIEGDHKAIKRRKSITAENDEAQFWADMARTFNGLIAVLEQVYLDGTTTQKEYLQPFMQEASCSACQGARLKSSALSVTLCDLSIFALGNVSIQAAYQIMLKVPDTLNTLNTLVAREPLQEVLSRLQFLNNVGLSYLTLNRSAASLSGGEAQRIRLASQLGAGLSGVLYVLDEPSIGLHPVNNTQLIETMKQLRDLGNTLIVVEHDEETMKAADWLVDIGPLAGRFGGQIVSAGTPAEVMADKQSVTGSFLKGERQLLPPLKTRPVSGEVLKITGIQLHNLKNITACFPLGLFTCVTGMSGSGKSTLIFDVLKPILKCHFGYYKTKPAGFKSVTGLEHLDKLIEIDQSPIGRTPRSNPATYTGVFDSIRNLFAASDEAKVKGFKPGHFSFNSPLGRCHACKGEGMSCVEMNFLPDVYTPCAICHGKRFNPESLSLRYHDKTIADVLAMTIDEAVLFFETQSNILKYLQVLKDVGLGYIQLGQASTTLSGGEAQRIKLATEFAKRSTGKTIYLLDEPTIGLHWQDLENLLFILNRLVEAGNTVIVIEHNLDFIKMADYVIDLGPDGGDYGGEIIVEGPPKKIAAHPTSYTGQYLKKALQSSLTPVAYS